MAVSRFRLTNLPVVALGVAAVGLGGAVVQFANGDAVVERSFERALASMDDGATAQRMQGTDVIVSAAEKQLQVTRTVHGVGTPLSKPVAVGDRITISSGGHDRVLNVVKVDRLDSSIVQASTQRATTPLLLVTCRDESKPDGRPVRFLIEADEPLPVLSSATTPRTL